MGLRTNPLQLASAFLLAPVPRCLYRASHYDRLRTAIDHCQEERQRYGV